MKLIMRLALLPLFLVSSTVKSQDGQFEKYIDSLMTTANRPGMPGSYLLVAQDGKPLVRKAFGLANIELNVPAKPEHLFTIASISKQMVAVAVLQLAAQNNLNLSDDIRKYFPSYNTHGKLITIENLLTHTSGIYSETGATGASGKTLFDLSVSHGVLSEDEFMNYAMQHPLFFDPGSDWGWNSYGFLMAFFIIEKVSGIPFNDYMRKNVFEPAGMANSFSKVDGNRLGMFGTKNLVNNFYQPDVDGKWTWKDFRRFTPMYFYERYAIATSLDDLMRWDIALREEKLLSKAWIEKAWQPFILKDGRTTHYGYGWSVSQFNGFRLLAHIGIGTNPICTVHVPEKKLYLVYTQFHGTFEQAELIIKKILSRLLPVPYPAATKAKAPLREYVGVYQVHRIGLRSTAQLSDGPVYMNVTTSGDTLFMQQTGAEKTMLRPAGIDRFLPARNENMFYTFVRNKKGEVEGVTASGSLWTFGPDVINRRVDIRWPAPVIPKLVDKTLLQKYCGVYYLTALDIYRFVETDGNKLYLRFQGARQELIAISDTKFVRKGAEDMTFEFKEDPQLGMIMTATALRAVNYRKVADSYPIR
jgi:CubicO group peptidase (beta-lactamase class C family)